MGLLLVFHIKFVVLFGRGMEQFYMIEIFVEKVELKIVPPEKDEFELREEAERLRLEAEAAAAAAALAKGKGKKGKRGKPAKPKGKKGKKGKQAKPPPGPTEEELRFLAYSTVTFECPTLFNFYVTHDKFVPPPPPALPPAKGKKRKKEKKTKKGKKGKAPKPTPVKIMLPAEPLPAAPYFNVGNTILFLSRPTRLREVVSDNDIVINVWNKDQGMDCIGFTSVAWDECFFEAIKRSEEMYPIRLDPKMHETKKPEIIISTLRMEKQLQCAEDLRLSGYVKFYIRLSCLGDRIVSTFATVPDNPALPGLCFLGGDGQQKEIAAQRHWQTGTIEDFIPIATMFAASDITESPKVVEEKNTVYEDYVAPFTNSELAILAMGFPKGPCGGTNCPDRLSNRGDDYQFVPGYYCKGTYITGKFVNVYDIHGPCGRLDCPLARNIRSYIENEGKYKPCKKPCTTDYY